MVGEERVAPFERITVSLNPFDEKVARDGRFHTIHFTRRRDKQGEEEEKKEKKRKVFVRRSKYDII